jgi:hypothetical protein
VIRNHKVSTIYFRLVIIVLSEDATGQIGGYADAKCKTAISTVTMSAPNSRSATPLIICYFSSQSVRDYRKGIRPEQRELGIVSDTQLLVE